MSVPEAVQCSIAVYHTVEVEVIALPCRDLKGVIDITYKAKQLLFK